MTEYIRHMQHSDKCKLAQQIGKILTQDGAVSYGVAKDILQICGKMLENSAVIEPLPGSIPESTTQVASPQESRSFIEAIREFGIDGIPDDHCQVQGEIASDGALLLNVSAFTMNGYLSSARIPFSDFSENCTSITDLKRLLVDTIYQPPSPVDNKSSNSGDCDLSNSKPRSAARRAKTEQYDNQSK